MKFYNKGEHENFLNFLEKKSIIKKNIVYTFSGYLEEIIEESDKLNYSLLYLNIYLILEN